MIRKKANHLQITRFRERIDPVVAKLIALFPEPNLPGELNNFTRNALAQDNNDSYNGRVDWTPSSSDTIFGRYNYSNRFRFIPGYFGGLADGSSTSAWGRQFLKNHSFVLGWTHIVSPSIVNDFRFGWIRNFSFAEQDPFALPQYAGSFVPRCSCQSFYRRWRPLLFQTSPSLARQIFFRSSRYPSNSSTTTHFHSCMAHKRSKLVHLFTCLCATSSRMSRACVAI